MFTFVDATFRVVPPGWAVAANGPGVASRYHERAAVRAASASVVAGHHPHVLQPIDVPPGPDRGVPSQDSSWTVRPHQGHDARGMARLAEDLTSVEGHVVQFYEREDELTAAVARFAGAGLAAGEGVLVVATPEHRAAFEGALRAERRKLDGYVALDAADTLALLLDHDTGRVDPSRFFDVVGGAVAAAADHPGGHVRVFGEMVALLWAAGDHDEAIVLEGLWNELAVGPHRFTLLCAYPTPSMDDPAGAARFYDACGEHTAVLDDPEAPLAAWRRFETGPAAISLARRFVTTTLDRWGYGDVADDAAIVVSELATNAVLHARSTFHVSVGVAAGEGEGVRIGVHDESPLQPSLRGYSITSATGRGLRMVDALSASWGSIPLPHRKEVWAELA